MTYSFARAALLALLVACSGAASAQSPAPGAPAVEPTASHLAAATELVQLTLVLAPIDELLPSFPEQIRRQNVSRPELTKDLEEVLSAMGPELQLQRRSIAGTVARIYAKWLTEPEIREIVAFFKTPVGVKYTRVQPDLSDEVVRNVELWTRDASEYMMIRVRAEMSKRGHVMQ
jgi:hypothetical protein